MSEDYSTLIHVSPFLTNENLSKALTEWFGETCTFTHWEYVGEIGKGDSYLSEIMKIKIFGDTKNTTKYVQVILKVIPKNVARRLTYRSGEFFKNEINFYQKVLPGLLNFQAKTNVREPFTQYVKLFLAYSNGINDVIVLEDVTPQNFKGAARQEGIDFNYCKTAFKALAQFHALSYAMRDQQPEKFAELKQFIFETYFNDCYFDWYKKFWQRICNIAIDAVEKEYPDSRYLEKVKQFAVPDTYKDMIKAVRTSDTGAISHGDCWLPNFLYKFENGEAVDAKLIDFQLCRCSTPILDLSFFIYSCTTQDMRLKFYNQLLEYYYEVLSTQIEGLGSDPNKVYSKELFMSEVKKYMYFGLGFSFESTPFSVMGPGDEFDLDKLQGDQKFNVDDFWQVNPFKTKEGRLREANNIVHCVDNGYI